MKRLIKLSKKRLIKKTAEWTPIDPSNEDVIQTITNFMASGTQIQIEYQGSGWRLIQPYGWNTSKDGNILLMCYKDTGEIRSYRLDRINQVLVDNSLLENQPVNDLYEIEDYNENPSVDDFTIPDLPNMDEIMEQTENEIGEDLPFSDGINYLTGNDTPIEEFNEIDINENNDDMNENNGDLNQNNDDDLNNINDVEEEENNNG